MNWQKRIHVITGISCWQLIFNLLIISIVIIGWIKDILIYVSLGFCLFYFKILFFMVFLEHFQIKRWRILSDIFEEFTTNWYLVAALTSLWLLSQILHSNLLLTLIGFIIFTEPTIISIIIKHRK